MAEEPEDDNKRKFREALERKQGRAGQQGDAGEKGERSKIHGAHGPESTQAPRVEGQSAQTPVAAVDPSGAHPEWRPLGSAEGDGTGKTPTQGRGHHEIASASPGRGYRTEG